MGLTVNHRWAKSLAVGRKKWSHKNLASKVKVSRSFVKTSLCLVSAGANGSWSAFTSFLLLFVFFYSFFLSTRTRVFLVTR